MSNGIIAGNTLGAYIVNASITPASVGAATTVEQTFVLTGVGLRVGDYIDVCAPTPNAGTALVNKRVSAPDTIALTWVNVTAGALTPTAGVHLLQICRPEGGVPKAAIGG